MLSFMSSLRGSSDAFAIFVTEKYEYRDAKEVLSKDISKKIDLFLKSLKIKKQQEDINSLDISDKKKCFIIKVKNKYQNNYFEEIGSSFFTYIKKLNFSRSIKISFYRWFLHFFLNLLEKLHVKLQGKYDTL